MEASTAFNQAVDLLDGEGDEGSCGPETLLDVEELLRTILDLIKEPPKGKRKAGSALPTCSVVNLADSLAGLNAYDDRDDYDVPECALPCCDDTAAGLKLLRSRTKTLLGQMVEWKDAAEAERVR